MRNRKRNHGSVHAIDGLTILSSPLSMIWLHLIRDVKKKRKRWRAPRDVNYTVLIWRGSVYSRVVCTERRNKRSQMGSFQPRAICTRVHDGAYCRDYTGITQLFAARRGCIPVMGNHWTCPLYIILDKGKRPSLFQLRSITAR